MIGEDGRQGDDDWLGRGMNCYLNQMDDTAVVLLSEAAKKDPENGLIYYVRALAYLELGKKKQAREDFLTAQKYDMHINKEFWQRCD